jgi:FkbM family methyltransferase
MVPDGKIVAVEAEKNCFNVLKRNMGKNGVTNVIPVNKAISGNDETVTLMTGGHQENTLIEGILDTSVDEKIEGVRIDSLVWSLSLEKVDMVSLTLNGAEVEALDGMVETIKKFRPRIRIAGWYYRNGRQVWQLCQEKLENYHYNIVVGKRGCLYAY